MLSFTFRRVLSHPGIFSIARRLPTRAISFNQSFAIAVQRNLTTTAGDRNSDPTADSKPQPKSDTKSTRRKTGSSPKTVKKTKKTKKTKKDKKKKKKKKEVEKKPKVVINSQVLPPSPPGNAFVQWLRDWISTQPKIETLPGAQDTVKRGSQIWNTLPEHEKQQYRERVHVLRDEYHRHITEWREKVDPNVLRELNRRRVAKGRQRIRGPPQPRTGYTRYFMRLLKEHPRTEGDYKTYFKAMSSRAASQWKAMSDAEKAEYNDLAKPDFDARREKSGAGSRVKA